VPETWLAWVERNRGLLGSLLGGRNRGIASPAVLAIHDALSAPEIVELRWHVRADFDGGHEQGVPEP
jgi:hypothetical protein